MSAHIGAIARVFEHDLGIPQPTSRDFRQRLRKDPTIFRRGVQGPHAPALSVQEVTNWLIALCAATATTRKSPDALETVRAVRAAPRLLHPDALAQCPPEAIESLGIGEAKTAGEAIDSLLDDMRSGAFARWVGRSTNSPDLDPPYILRIRFVNGGRDVLVNTLRFPKDARSQQAFICYRDEQRLEPGHYLTFTHELEGYALEHLASALGTTD